MMGLEFVQPLFIGNVILVHSLVKLLLSQDFDVAVSYGQPKNALSHSLLGSNSSNNEEKKIRKMSVPVPFNKQCRPDNGSAWEDMADNAPETALLSEDL